MKVGSLVVCVDDVFESNDGYFDDLRKLGIKFPIKDKVYTIREIENDVPPTTGIRLEEIINRKLDFLDANDWEQSFSIKRFRELDTPQSISIEEILEEPVYA